MIFKYTVVQSSLLFNFRTFHHPTWKLCTHQITALHRLLQPLADVSLPPVWVNLTIPSNSYMQNHLSLISLSTVSLMSIRILACVTMSFPFQAESYFVVYSITYYLSNPLSMDIQTVFSFGLLWLMLPWRLMYKYLFESLFPILLFIYQR